MPKHHVITELRGTDHQGRPGYAAFCEDCPAATFGGFPSRHAARQELAGHEKAPDLSGNSSVEGENQNTNHHEGEPIMSTVTTTEPIRPIYGPSDPRWTELAEWLHTHQHELPQPVNIEDFYPSERANWYHDRILGEGLDAYRRLNVEWPDLPTDRLTKPEWAEHLIDGDLAAITQHPLGRWVRHLDERSTIEQEVTYNPDTNEITTNPPFLSVWITDNDGANFATAEAARDVARQLLAVADEFDRLTAMEDAK